jgi:sulfur-carrier protein
MVQVTLSGSLKAAARGPAVLEIEAGTIRQLLDALEKQVPGLEDHLEQGVAVSINGQIFRDDWFREIPADAEVFVLPRLAGG